MSIVRKCVKSRLDAPSIALVESKTAVSKRKPHPPLLLDDEQIVALARTSADEALEATVVPSLPNAQAEQELAIWLQHHPGLRERLTPERLIATEVNVGSERQTSYVLLLDRASVELLLAR